MPEQIFNLFLESVMERFMNSGRYVTKKKGVMNRSSHFYNKKCGLT